jgi:hypothetical protein
LFLRRTGGGYIFIHRLLLEYFADLETSGEEDTPESTIGQEESAHALK